MKINLTLKKNIGSKKDIKQDKSSNKTEEREASHLFLMALGSFNISVITI